jgi:uncharacterized protein (TIGR02246 family)
MEVHLTALGLVAISNRKHWEKNDENPRSSYPSRVGRQLCFNKNDASALAALFTEDAVLVAPDGTFVGRQAIEKRYVDMFQQSPITSFYGNRSQLNAIDNAAWSVAEWWSTLQAKTGAVFGHGYKSAIYVREGDAWKIRMWTLSALGH